MRFWEAIKELESGEKIRRRHFSHIICSFLDLADFLTGSGIVEIYSHLNADWELWQITEKTYSFQEVIKGLGKGKSYCRKTCTSNVIFCKQLPS